jgi:sulfide:quinone oxidoreductase
MRGKTILILGGGVGGIVTANALRESLASEHRIVVVDKRAEYIFTPSLLWVMTGWRQPDQITKDLRHMLQFGIEVVQAEVQEIDPERAIVRDQFLAPRPVLPRCQTGAYVANLW